MHPRVLVALPLLGCLPLGCASDVFTLGSFEVTVDRSSGALTVEHPEHGDRLEDVRLAAGVGSAEVEMSFGSFLFTEEDTDWVSGAGIRRPYETDCFLLLTLEDPTGEVMGELVLSCYTDDALALTWSPYDPDVNRLRLSAACTGDDHFLGAGAHAMDVDHVGQAFPLWVSEPGIGKVEDEDPPDDWYLTGTRHDSSYPVPFLLRPEQPHGILANTTARVEVDLCASDPDRFEVVAWSDSLETLLLSGSTPLEVVESLTGITGRIDLPPAWAFGPWNDAIEGSERVLEVADTIREADAPGSVIWTEDWKGGETSITGYHLKGEWFLDEDLYPDAAGLDATLEAAGFKWLAYFSPFLVKDTETWESAEQEDLIIHDEDGEPYTFVGVTGKTTSLLDLTHSAAEDWAVSWMEEAVEHGFDGWMADYGEWLPTDAVLASGEDALRVHNRYPRDWQAVNHTALEGEDAVFFSRSGWAGATGIAPVVWGGDQRTSFDSDDGLPTVLALGLGLSACGVPVFTHDVAGYQSVGNDPSDRELWYRWAALGAFSPIFRTHHGAFEDENWQFDTDEETLAWWAELAREHTRLLPYRYGLAARAAEDGTPMVLPTGFLFDGEPWDRADAWMLGEALLVAPVLERGADGRDVDLPEGTTWYDWWTLEPASSGYVEAAIDEIPVFAAAGTTVPVLTEIPQTLVDTADDTWTTLADVDDQRTVYLFGGGGTFTEADGTRYTPSGTPNASGETETTLTSGSAEVAGMTVEIEGTEERTYRLVVVH